ncbi:hypothetical protein BDW66DRAFT_30927 [Aspergillus desertorum]
MAPLFLIPLALGLCVVTSKVLYCVYGERGSCYIEVKQHGSSSFIIICLRHGIEYWFEITTNIRCCCSQWASACQTESWNLMVMVTKFRPVLYAMQITSMLRAAVPSQYESMWIRYHA